MIGQFIANAALAFIWMFLQNTYEMPTFVAGYLLGMLMLFLFGRKTGQRFYMVKVWKIVKLAGIFIREMIIACFQVLVLVIGGVKTINPGIIEYQTELETPMQITLLANMITLTPGTITLEVTDDKKSLFIHVLKIDSADSIREGIKRNFEDNIKEVLA